MPAGVPPAVCLYRTALAVREALDGYQGSIGRQLLLHLLTRGRDFPPFQDALFLPLSRSPVVWYCADEASITFSYRPAVLPGYAGR